MVSTVNYTLETVYLTYIMVLSSVVLTVLSVFRIKINLLY